MHPEGHFLKPHTLNHEGYDPSHFKLGSMSFNGVKVELYYDIRLCKEDVDRVLRYFCLQEFPERILSEDRSVILPSQSGLEYDGLKIKGAGYKGGIPQFKVHHPGAYSLPHFDYEGLSNTDRAKDFHRAYLGGMSYQQARHEFNVLRYLRHARFDTWETLGYGAIIFEGKISWVLVLNVPFKKPQLYHEFIRRPEDTQSVAAFYARSQNELSSLGVFMILNGITSINDRFIRKDLHTAFLASESDSPFTKLFNFLFDVKYILDHFNHSVFAPKNVAEQNAASLIYMKTLTGHEWSKDSIMDARNMLKRLCLTVPLGIGAQWKILTRNARLGRVRYGDYSHLTWLVWKKIFQKSESSLEKRVQIIRKNPIGKVILDRFLSPFEREVFIAVST